ncbi:hypothetical protein Dcar01_03547 [Deinococcus carri]|uniref:Holliday junction resolvase n=1 Tax=Deinococcus carri TaxID=1211323 RepID=A0ABP9WBS5_9DEIO
MTAPTRKKPVNSRAKGANGERELAKVLTDLGYPARRGQQFRGGAESPDVVCESLKGWHIEAKRTATCQMFSPATLKNWMEQARRDCGGRRMPIVIHRWNGARDWWVLVMPYARPWYWQRLDLFLKVERELQTIWGLPE